MKLRPQMQLRFRDVEQFTDVKTIAAEERLSVNEWVLQRIEQVPMLKGAKIAKERQAGKQTIRASHVVKDESKEPTDEQNAAKGKAEVKGEDSAGKCPLCGKGLIAWGSQNRCVECKRNF